ncbi:MAG TPA: helix-turn-helix transcriptional regulator, partial [Mycobacteriales bacterium]|nr:helix-turn-helix transcriptional regulator [Mycobacteriales bacterium]
GRDHRVAATPPDTALEPLLVRSHDLLERTGKSIAELADLYHSSDARRGVHELVQVVVGADAVRQRFEQLQHGAHSEVLIFVRPPRVLTETNQTELRLLRQGVRFRSLYDRAALRVPGAMDEILLYQSEGEQSRTVETLPMKLAVADRSLGLVPLSTRDSAMEPGAVVVHPSAMLDGMVTLFESLWQHAVPLDSGADGQERRPRRPPLAEQDSRILGLLLAGQTDEAVARQLGLSLRTVQRRVQRLMSSARVTTRLQLGWYAHKQGWL